MSPLQAVYGLGRGPVLTGGRQYVKNEAYIPSTDPAADTKLMRCRKQIYNQIDKIWNNENTSVTLEKD